MRHTSRLLAVVAVLVLVAGCSSGDDEAGPDTSSTTEDAPAGDPSTTAAAEPGEVVPGDDWVVADPADHGFDPAGLEEARAYAFAPGRETQGVVVVHGGEIVAEWYADGADADSWAASWSVAKSFTSAVVGIAVEEGHIGGVEEPMSTYLPEWAGTEHDAITIEDVLHMASGLDWNEAYAGSGEESQVVRMVTGEADQLAFARARPRRAEPGTSWSYSSGDTMLLSGVVQEATGRPLDDYAAEVLLDPIGLDRIDWWRDVEGHTLGYCCVDTTSRDFARLGLLYARDGRWGDEQVVPEAWVEESLVAGPASDGEYGYQWWLGDPEGVPEDHFAAQGHDGQYIHVIPSLDLVVVRNGTYVKDPGPPIADPTLFSRYPSDGYVPGKGTVPPDEWDDAAFLAPIVAALDA
jgi:CubicO group peptidase (beta-lactamase class C family)